MLASSTCAAPMDEVGRWAETFLHGECPGELDHFSFRKRTMERTDGRLRSLGRGIRGKRRRLFAVAPPSIFIVLIYLSFDLLFLLHWICKCPRRRLSLTRISARFAPSKWRLKSRCRVLCGPYSQDLSHLILSIKI